jgi:hypothetical protein
MHAVLKRGQVSVLLLPEFGIKIACPLIRKFLSNDAGKKNKEEATRRTTI